MKTNLIYVLIQIWKVKTKNAFKFWKIQRLPKLNDVKMKENLDEVSEMHLLFVFSFYEKEKINK